jgi:hypothetical protein
MDAGDSVLAVEIGQRSSHAQGPVITARAQRKCIGSVPQECEAGTIGRGNLLEQLAVAFGIGADLRLTELGESSSRQSPRASKNIKRTRKGQKQAASEPNRVQAAGDRRYQRLAKRAAFQLDPAQ